MKGKHVANSYCMGSVEIPIPTRKKKKAREIIERVSGQLEQTDTGFGLTVEHTEEGVVLYNEENFDPEQAEAVMRALVEELSLPKVFVCSWAYTCSKPRPGHFGGGAFVLSKDRATYWLDAENAVLKLFNGVPL